MDSSPLLLQPAGLDLPALLKETGIADQWAKPKAREKLMCVVHLILEGAHRNRTIENSSFWVQMHSQRLRDLLTSRSDQATIQTLCELGVIEANGSYSVGWFPKSFRLGGQYRDAPLTFHPLTDRRLAQKLNAYDDARTAEAIGGNRIRAEVLDSLRRTALSPDAQVFAETFPFSSSEQQGTWLFTLRDLARRRLWLRADGQTGRIFHNVTQCPRELRPFLLIDGEPTAEVDIAAAQPFFALSLFPPDHPERRAYAEFVTSPDFYASLFYRIPKPKRRAWGTEYRAWTEPGSTHRERFKKHTLRHVFYDRTPEGDAPSVFEAFRSVSPWLAGELALRRSGEAGNCDLARELQSREAELMLGRVIPRIESELEGCHAVTIHDGVLCQERFAADVACIVREETEKMFGAQAQVRVKSGSVKASQIAA